ncbi:MAG TPA: zf-HC2 domain-containing protein [Thermomicrobiaceae bacterium]|nr:zf-HC2 domain-containing protein [Thermomicrobiaceae bacterium]
MTDCETFGPFLSAWMDDDLAPGERRAVARHLVGCPDCQQTLRAYGGVRRLLRAMPHPEPPRSVARAVRARLTAAPPSWPLDWDVAGDAQRDGPAL